MPVRNWRAIRKTCGTTTNFLLKYFKTWNLCHHYVSVFNIAIISRSVLYFIRISVILKLWGTDSRFLCELMWEEEDFVWESWRRNLMRNLMKYASHMLQMQHIDQISLSFNWDIIYISRFRAVCDRIVTVNCSFSSIISMPNLMLVRDWTAMRKTHGSVRSSFIRYFFKYKLCAFCILQTYYQTLICL